MQTKMLRSRFSKTALFSIPSARPRLRHATALLLQPRSTPEQSRPFTNPPKPDLVKVLCEIARAETLKTKGNTAQQSEDSRRSNSLKSFKALFLDDMTERFLRKRELRFIHREAQQSIEELHQILKADCCRAVPNWTAEERETLKIFLKKHGLMLAWSVCAAEVIFYAVHTYVAYKVCQCALKVSYPYHRVIVQADRI